MARKWVLAVVPLVAVLAASAVPAWSACGNGILEAGESCDQGAANGTVTSCCTALCEFRTPGATCRTAAGACDVVETCTGSSGTCPPDAVRPPNFICRSAAGVCDVQETCTGSTAACPGDAFQPSTMFCRPSAGACDPSEFCTGTSVDCPPDDKSTAVCRASAGPCDVAESCDGVSNDCPPDSLVPAGTECRAVADVCDVAENCTGSSASCPADAFEPSSTTCRASAGVCDPAENCTGTGASCPADAKSTAVCRSAAGACDVAESCDGVSDDCPPDGKSTAECRAAAGPCDVAETCDGSSNDCPPDGFASATTVCRGAAGVCDVAEQCNGSDAVCPPDGKSTAVCRPVAGACDVAESCDGSSNACPSDTFLPATTVCRPAAPQCDVAENCTGVGAACPPDAFQPDGSPCDDGIACTADACQGGACVGNPDLDTCLDDFLCYRTKTQQAPTLPVVHLEDAFEAGDYQVVKGRDLCPPADKNGTGIVDATTHLRTYQIKAVAGTPRHQRRSLVMVDNQLGQLDVDTVKPDILLVPANADLNTPPSPPAPDINVDHFKCYKIKVSPGTPAFPKNVVVSLADEFTNPPKSFLLTKPRHLCNPVDKNHEGIKNPTAHLLSYKLKGGVPKHVRRTCVQVTDQFGGGVIDTVKEDEVCIPSTAMLPP